jgi:hypothetical protein
MSEAVSACRACRRNSSRDLLPGGSLAAASLNLLASAANRSSKVNVCLTRGRNLTMATPFHLCPLDFLSCNKSRLSGTGLKDQKWADPGFESAPLQRAGTSGGGGIVRCNAGAGWSRRRNARRNNRKNGPAKPPTVLSRSQSRVRVRHCRPRSLGVGN